MSAPKKSDARQLARFAENLRLACSYVKSVSEVCRHLNVHRRQFARYLNGDTLPSPHNLRKICDFFGVEEQEVFLSSGRFRRLLSIKPRVGRRSPAASSTGSPDPAIAGGMASGLRYVGYFFRYLRSAEHPGQIVKAAAQVFVADDRLRTKAIERIKSTRGVQRRCETHKYDGVFMMLADRIFIVETDSPLHLSISETILYPTHKHPMTLLYGEAFGVSSGAAREPYVTPMVYEFIGTQVNLRGMLAQCGLYEERSAAIDERIRRYVRHLQRGPSSMCALHQ